MMTIEITTKENKSCHESASLLSLGESLLNEIKSFLLKLLIEDVEDESQLERGPHKVSQSKFSAGKVQIVLTTDSLGWSKLYVSRVGFLERFLIERHPELRGEITVCVSIPLGSIAT